MKCFPFKNTSFLPWVKNCLHLISPSPSHLTTVLELCCCWGFYLIYKENICPVKLLKSSNTIQAFLMFWLLFRLLIWERLLVAYIFWRSLSGNILAPTRVAVAVFLYKHQPVLLFSSTDYLSPTQTRRILIWDKMKRNQRRHFCFLSFS